MKRREVENDIEALIRTLNTTLEFIRDRTRAPATSESCSHRPQQCRRRPAPLAASRCHAESATRASDQIGSQIGFEDLEIRVILARAAAAFAGLRDGALLVRLAAAPVDGAANAS